MRATRRAFLRWLLAGCGVVAAAVAGVFSGLTSRRFVPAKNGGGDAGVAPRVLSDRAFRFVDDFAARLLPSGAAGRAGAREAAVAVFIDRQMADPSFRVFREQIEEAAKKHADFVTLSEGEQDAWIRRVQVDDTFLFQVLLTLSLEGMFSDPRHGGNRDCAGWRLLGVSPRGCHRA